MTSRLSPYLNFRGQAREAMEFYRSVFGGELTVSTFADFQMPVDAGEEQSVMHSELVTESGFRLMGSDVPSSMGWSAGENQFSVALMGDAASAAELTANWAKLIEGANVTMPLQRAPWGDDYGQCIDRFGVPWMIDVAATTA